MSRQPLAAPTDSRLLQLVIDRFGLPASQTPEQLLGQVASAMSRLPYENLTKIVKAAETGRPQEARRLPDEVLRDHFALGAGGTCFSLTATMLHLVRALGLRAEPILADRRYGENTHCALVVWIGERPHLLDPGYLIVDPIALDHHESRCIQTAFNQLILSPHGDGKIDLFTVQQGVKTYRLTFKTAPVDAGQFIRAWDASFDWDMMRYPLLSCVRDEAQLYLRGNYFQRRSARRVDRAELPPEQLGAEIAKRFGVDLTLTIRALRLLHRQGERPERGT